MIDYTKILIKHTNVNRLLNFSILDFKTEVSKRTGELSNKSIAEFHFCKIVIYDSGLVFFKGSIHKFWNSLNDVKAPNYKNGKNENGFNGNQFTINDIVEVRKYLENLFDCKPSQMIFQNIEFGINSEIDFKPQLFIKGLLYHKGKPFEHRFNQNFAQVKHQRYYLKIYNKSNQYEMKTNIVRVELKVVKTEDLKNIGIKTFADINSLTLDNASKLLLKRFDEVVYYDYTISANSLTEHQKRTLERYTNPRYWIDELKPNFRYRHRKRLQNFINKNSQITHYKIRQDIIQKCSIINRYSENRNKSLCSIINPSNIGLDIQSDTEKNIAKRCKLTRVDISMQKEHSLLLSHSGLKTLKKHNPDLFNIILNKYLTKLWVEASYQKQIEEIAHNIRNKYYNTIRSKSNKFNKNQTSLFNKIL